jgi:hypothetical protein
LKKRNAFIKDWVMISTSIFIFNLVVSKL